MRIGLIRGRNVGADPAHPEAAKIDRLSEDAVKLVETFGDEERQQVDALTRTIMDLGPAVTPTPATCIRS